MDNTTIGSLEVKRRLSAPLRGGWFSMRQYVLSDLSDAISVLETIATVSFSRMLVEPVN